MKDVTKRVTRKTTQHSQENTSPKLVFGQKPKPKKTFEPENEGRDKREPKFSRERKPFGDRNEKNTFGERNGGNSRGNRQQPLEAKELRGRGDFSKPSGDRNDKPAEKQRGERNTFSGRSGNSRGNRQQPFEVREQRGRGNAGRPQKKVEKPVFDVAQLPRDRHLLRLNRYLAQAGVASRREADELISAGKVRVNGEIVTELGRKVHPTNDRVEFEGKVMKPQTLVYLLLNKPKNFITTTEDPEGRRTVMDLVRNATKERIFPVGRLDRNTTGLLLFTNDGELAERLMHPSHKTKKIYHVRLNRDLKPEDMDMLRQGVMLEDGEAHVDKIDYVLNRPMTEVGVEIHIGKNRIVRRLFEHLGYTVEALDRTMLGHLTKKNLPRGHWRMLSEKEVSFLKML